MPVGSKIVGVDLEPIRAIPGTVTIVGDITAQKTRQARRFATPSSSRSAPLLLDPQLDMMSSSPRTQEAPRTFTKTPHAHH